MTGGVENGAHVDMSDFELPFFSNFVNKNFSPHSWLVSGSFRMEIDLKSSHEVH